MTDYTLNKEVPLTDTQNEIVGWLLARPTAVVAAQTGL